MSRAAGWRGCGVARGANGHSRGTCGGRRRVHAPHGGDVDQPRLYMCVLRGCVWSCHPSKSNANQQRGQGGGAGGAYRKPEWSSSKEWKHANSSPFCCSVSFDSGPMLSESPSSSLPPLVLSRPRCDFASRDFRRKSPDWTMAGTRPSPRAPLSRRREARQCGRLTQRESPFSLLPGRSDAAEREEVLTSHTARPRRFELEAPGLPPPFAFAATPDAHRLSSPRLHRTRSRCGQARRPRTRRRRRPRRPFSAAAPLATTRNAVAAPCCRVLRPCARRRRLGHLFRLALGRQKTPHTRHVSLCSVADPVTDRLASRPRAQISHPYHNVERQPSHPWLRQPAP